MSRALKMLLLCCTLGGILLAGAVIGAVAAVRYQERRPEGPGRHPGAFPPQPEQFNARLMGRFAGQLDLTDAQRDQIVPLVDGAAADLRQLRAETSRRAEVIVVGVEGRIAAVLTPDQRVRFDDLVRTQRERIQRYRFQQQQRYQQQRFRP